MMPMPPFTFASAHDTGQGFAMSKMRNRTKPAATSHHANGSHSSGSSAIHWPTNSSQTTKPGSSMRSARTTRAQAHTPSANATVTTAKYNGHDSSRSANHSSSA